MPAQSSFNFCAVSVWATGEKSPVVSASGCRTMELPSDSMSWYAEHELKEEEMVTIEHIAMYVQDMERAVEFFERYFAAVPGEVYHNVNTNFRSRFLSFSGGCRLELMHRPQMDDTPKSQTRTGYIHLALSLGSQERVDSLTAQLNADGYEIASGPRTTGDGYYESCVIAFEGNLIELTV